MGTDRHRSEYNSPLSPSAIPFFFIVIVIIKEERAKKSEVLCEDSLQTLTIRNKEISQNKIKTIEY
jgi:hypothetical protein